MSRIGKKLLVIPAGVELTLQDREVTVKGPKGTIKIPLPAHVAVEFSADKKEASVKVEKEDDIKQRALWGLVRQLVANAVEGVQKPFSKSLEFVGVGFRVAVEGKKINIEVGFSHPVKVDLPEGIQAAVDKQILTITGIDKQAVGEFAARIRRIKPPEPYKGKGIKYTTETIRRKAGKAAAKA
ncbi:MAG: 50S ribosomal protein L6 [Patescibacteria group bacterium]|jgi:large subunit ribosomal protein L6|nr:50S ribosomal protein L6 [Patescibacteria group bacterium]